MPPAGNGVRLDIFLAEATELSRRAARRVVADGSVLRNGEPIRVQSRTVVMGDVIDVQVPPKELGVPARPSLESVQILHHDRWILAAAKPSGVLSAPAERMAPDELAFDQLVLLSVALDQGRRPFLRLLHRLDRMTSGAVLFARHADALPALTTAWSRGKVERVYMAVVEGQPPFDERVIDEPIGRDRSHTWRFTVDPRGRSARTEIDSVVRLENELAFVCCRLITGRTHQVRVHLAAIGHPVLGDRLYGSTRASEAPRPLLHAASITLPHPHSGEPLTIVCPTPEDIAGYLPDDVII